MSAAVKAAMRALQRTTLKTAAQRGLQMVLVYALTLFAGNLSAHEMSMAELELRQVTPTDFYWRWTASGRRPAEDVLKVVWPEGCLEDNGVLSCGSAGLKGKLTVKGVGRGYSAAMVKLYWLDGPSHVYTLTGSQPTVRLYGSADAGPGVWSYLNLGLEHIALGVDHLLFVLGLLLIVRDRWMLVKTISAFTLSHSFTLAVATFGIAHVPVLPLNAAIALSILFLGPEIVRSWRGGTSLTIRHPWVVAFLFGLLHGFGFASGLAELGLPEQDIPLALLMFNIGVEAGQIAFVVLILLLERSLRLLDFSNSQLLARSPGYLVGALGAFWTIQRVAMLFKGAL